MGGFVRSTYIRFSHSLLLLVVVRYLLISQLSLTIRAGNRFQQHEKLELQRSMDRYRHLLLAGFSRDVLQAVPEDQEEQQNDLQPQSDEKETQVDERKSNEEHQENQFEEETKTVDEGPESNDSEELNTSQPEEVVEEVVEDPFVFPEPYVLGPPVRNWDEQRSRWLDQNPHLKTNVDGKPRVLVVTGSQPWPCNTPRGDNFHLKSLKIKIDYARMHNYEIYYNFAWLDPLFGSYWIKLPLIRKLMLTHPEIEWFLWIDSDAVFTDLLFEAPLESFEGSNMIMWGWKHGFYKEKSWISVNAGVFFIRNCQWSLDLFDKWAPMGPEGPVRDEYGKILSKFLSGRPENYPSDDQSALVYLMITDEEVSKAVAIVEDEFKMSAWWVSIVEHFETMIEKYHPGLGDERWPWITHFTGCSPCGGGNNPNWSYDMCMENFERAFNFADNQMLAFLGLEHESLSSTQVIRTRNETVRPLDWVGVNPWAERIAQLAAEASGDQ